MAKQLFQNCVRFIALALWGMILSISTFANDCVAVAAEEIIDRAPGPILPDPDTTIVIHRLFTDLATVPVEAGKTRVDSTGYVGGTTGFSSLNSVFIRDYYPFQVWEKTSDGKLRPTLLSYLSINTLSWGGRPHLAGPIEGPVNPPPGFDPGARLYLTDPSVAINPPRAWMNVKTLPLLFEGGNLIPTHDYLLVGKKVLDQNNLDPNGIQNYLSRFTLDPNLKKSFTKTLQDYGYRQRNEDEVRAELASGFKTSAQKVIFLEWMPGEILGHVDMWIGQIQGNTVAVPTIPEWMIAHLQGDYAFEADFARKIRGWLDQQSTRLEAQGLKVVRVPMPAPKNLKSSAISAFGYDADFLSTVNWIPNGKGQILVPIYENALSTIPGGRERYIQEVTLALKPFSQTPVFVNTDKMLGTHGVLHCISSSVVMPTP